VWFDELPSYPVRSFTYLNDQVRIDEVHREIVYNPFPLLWYITPETRVNAKAMCDARLNCFHTYGWHMQHRKQQLWYILVHRQHIFVPLHTMKAYWGMESVTVVLNLRTRRRSVVSLRPRPFYTQEQFETFWIGRNQSLCSAGIRTLYHPARSLVTILTTISYFHI
jgi:hypothetical protein